MKSSLAALVASVILSLTAAGCTSVDEGSRKPTEALSPSQPATARQDMVGSAHDFVHLIRSTVRYDYEPAGDPVALLKRADLVVEGTVDTVADGRIQGDPKEAPSHFVVVGVAPSETFKADSNRKGELVYVEIPRPDDFRATRYLDALPTGTPMFLFGSNADEPVYTPVSNNFAGREEGSSIYAAQPQGLFVADPKTEDLEPVFVSPDELGAGWNGIKDLESLRAALR